MDHITRDAARNDDTALLPPSLCKHTPRCPSGDSPAAEGARVVAAHPEQGWSLLCNGVVLFDDTGELLPDGRIIGPHRCTDLAEGAPPRRPGDPVLATGTARGRKGCRARIVPPPST